MKKIACLALVFAVFGWVSISDATLIGIKAYEAYAPVPDVMYDSGGTAKYTSTSQLFEVLAWDQTLYLEKPGPGIGINPHVGFGIAIKVDSSGNLVGGVDSHTYTWGSEKVITDYDMIEYVLTDFSFTWNNQTYNFYKGDIFLAGEIQRFGWQDNSPGNLDEFDFIFTNLSGKLIEYGLWPDNPIPIGAYLDTADIIWRGGGEPWGGNMTTSTSKGNKYPIPEPATILLLGVGMVGMGFVARRRRK